MPSQSTTSLFRPEALEAQKTQLLGSILLIRPLSFAILSIAALVIAAAIIVLIVFGEYTKRARITGVVAPERGIIKVMPIQVGVLTHRFVVEGQRVIKGEPLFRLSLDHSTASSTGMKAAGGGASHCWRMRRS